jgi:subtilisin
MRRLPAYSDAFTYEALTRVPAVLPPEEITPEWAWGGSWGAGVKVAVFDSGIEGDHPGLAGPPVAGYVAFSQAEDGTIVPNDQPHRDLFGHGTACASIIRQIAPECELYSVQVLGSDLGGKAAVLAEGMRWAIEHRMHVCNLSLGTTQREFFAQLHHLADLAYFHNVLLVCAANNLPFPSFPAVYASVISVACHGRTDRDVYLYNPHPPVEFGAPGIELEVPWRDGTRITVSGNSFAAPHMTGHAARILGKHPGMTPFETKSVLRMLAENTVKGIDASGNPQ